VAGTFTGSEFDGKSTRPTIASPTHAASVAGAALATGQLRATSARHARQPAQVATNAHATATR